MAEMKTRKELEGWLNARPEASRHEDAIIIAVRCALRVFPLLSYETDSEKHVELVISPLFRATLTAVVACDYPTLAVKVRESATRSATDSALSAAGSAARSAARSAAGSAAGSARSSAGSALSAARSAAGSAARSAGSARSAAGSALSAADSARSADRIWQSINQDLSFLTTGVAAKDLLTQSLWQDGIMPTEISNHWTEMKQNLLTQDQSWQVWTNWYEARLNGVRPHTPLEVARASIPDQVWEQNPAVVNQYILHIEKLFAEEHFVFLSYQHDDRPYIQEVRDHLIHRGIPVWYDQDINNGEPWRTVVKERLHKATLVSTFWTQNSVKSPAVTEEASTAQSQGKLVHFANEKEHLPFGFSESQYDPLNDATTVASIISTAFDKNKNALGLGQNFTAGETYVFEETETGQKRLSTKYAPISEPEQLDEVLDAIPAILEETKKQVGNFSLPEFEAILNLALNIHRNKPNVLYSELVEAYRTLEREIRVGNINDGPLVRLLMSNIKLAADILTETEPNVRELRNKIGDREAKKLDPTDRDGIDQGSKAAQNLSNKETAATLQGRTNGFLTGPQNIESWDGEYHVSYDGYFLASSLPQMRQAAAVESQKDKKQLKKVFDSAEDAAKKITAMDKAISVLLKLYDLII